MLSWTMKAVMMVAFLATITSAAEDDPAVLETEIDDRLDTELSGDPAGKLVSIGQAGAGITAVLQAAILTACIIGLVLLFSAIFKAISVKLYPEQLEEYDTYSYYNRKDTYYNHPSSYGYYDSRSSQRSLANNESFFTRILNSIDPVESAFAMLQVNELACRRRTVCELQQAATRMPLVASLVDYISPSIRGLKAYKEAQEAGAALEDCALLFSECSTT